MELRSFHALRGLARFIFFEGYCTQRWFTNDPCLREFVRAILRKKPMIALLEPEAKRGKVQSTAYLVRACGFISSRLLVGFGMNTPEYSGTFKAGLGFRGVVAIFGLISAAMAPVSWLYVREEKVRAPALRAYFAGVWRLMSGSAFFAAFIFSIGYPAINYIAPPVSTDIKLYWAGVQNFQSQIFGIVAYVIYAIGMDITRKRLLNFSWRKMIVYTTVTLNVIDTAMVLLVVYAVVRNQYFFLDDTLLLALPNAAGFIVSIFVIVELADEGEPGCAQQRQSLVTIGR